MIYEPSDDSYLLGRHVERSARGSVLDMGCGEGYQTLKSLKRADKVLGVDINPEAVSHCSKLIKHAEFRLSDLFSAVPESFDVIIFNPPYLPEEPEEPKDCALATCGGRQGFETLIQFFKQARAHLKHNAFVLTVFSSLSKPELIFERIKALGYAYEIIESKKLFFEELFILRAWLQ